MFGNRTILFWFREPQWNPSSPYFNVRFDECSRFIPVYCFDQREEQYFDHARDYLNFRNETIEKVAALRDDLQKKGSNLLIVNGSYEVIIPSLSRVLQADEVIADADFLNIDAPELIDFRKRKTNEIQYNLSMHSISMKIESIPNSISELTDSFHLPPFPEINAGIVPLKAQLITSQH